MSPSCELLLLAAQVNIIIAVVTAVVADIAVAVTVVAAVAVERETAGLLQEIFPRGLPSQHNLLLLLLQQPPAAEHLLHDAEEAAPSLLHGSLLSIETSGHCRCGG